MSYVSAVESLSNPHLAFLIVHVSKNDYYGGRLASLRFEDFVNTISSVASFTDRSRTPSEAADSVSIVNIRKPFGCAISYGEAHWCLNEKFNGFAATSTSLPVGPSTTVVLHENVDETILTSSGTSSAVPNRVENMDNVPDDQTTLTSAPDANASSSVNPAWNRASLEQKLRRVDLDLLPKIIYAESPTVTALLRADVTRYLEFRFVSRLLAMTVPPSSGTEYPPAAPGSNLEAVVYSGSTELQEHAVEPTRIVQVSAMFSYMLINFDQHYFQVIWFVDIHRHLLYLDCEYLTHLIYLKSLPNSLVFRFVFVFNVILFSANATHNLLQNEMSICNQWQNQYQIAVGLPALSRVLF
ncbi:Rab proteins geranylgeranyltransferase component A 2 [Fasciola gigantica]|uniref:Rab proteins geranylgeranyltransferase component A 2 n=1 Tax=Fasciola gigantica TaxID=46835 RepID=A0A504YJR8_FASGI|nr:Rab proteins geranylgeranyltransferase component A 2 [Fasciola gigantica]